jgi:hypothetical protein
MGRSSSFAVELNCLCGLATATPAILAAGTGLVGGIGMTMFSCKDEEQEGTIKVLAVLVCRCHQVLIILSFNEEFGRVIVFGFQTRCQCSCTHPHVLHK